jgi:anaerobic magnesium-protoporphyrin IX monomethyl ester cyclase
VHVVFVQDLYFEQIGLMSLAALLRARGHRTSVVLASDPAEVVIEVGALEPDLVGVSVPTIRLPWTRRVCAALKAALGRDLPIVLGGPHPTFAPDVLCEPWVDWLVRGEGEEAFPALCDRLDEGADPRGIPNLSWKDDEGLPQHNPLGPFLPDLDALPWPRRALYYDSYAFLARNSIKPFIASRGCPYKCTFCFNEAFRDMHPDPSGYLRFRSPDDLCGEILEVRDRHGLERVHFYDDIFNWSRRWLGDFLDVYARRVGLPFRCNVVAQTLDRDLARQMAAAGCYQVSFGVESGSTEIRRRLLKKHVSDEQILRCATALHEAGIEFHTTNIFGSPGERLEDALDTVRLNARLRPQSVIGFVFQPYEGLELTQVGLEQGLIQPETPHGEFRSFAGRYVEGEEMDEVLRVQKLFSLGVRFPRLIPAIGRAARRELGPVYQGLFFLGQALGYRERSGKGWLEVVREAPDLLRQYRTYFRE